MVKNMAIKNRWIQRGPQREIEGIMKKPVARPWGRVGNSHPRRLRAASWQLPWRSDRKLAGAGEPSHQLFRGVKNNVDTTAIFIGDRQPSFS
jgi:hypothetical protein